LLFNVTTALIALFPISVYLYYATGQTLFILSLITNPNLLSLSFDQQPSYLFSTQQSVSHYFLSSSQEPLYFQFGVFFLVRSFFAEATHLIYFKLFSMCLIFFGFLLGFDYKEFCCSLLF
jgi:hypothetical protein